MEVQPTFPKTLSAKINVYAKSYAYMRAKYFLTMGLVFKETKNGHRSRLALRPTGEVCQSSTPGPGNVSSSGNRVCFDFRTTGHLNPDWKDGIYSSGCGSRVGAVLNSRESSDGIAECPEEGKAIGSATDSAIEPSRVGESESGQSNREIQFAETGSEIRDFSLGNAASDNGAKRGI